MQALRERGEGKLGSLIWLVVIAGLVYAGWNVVPLYIDNFELVDKTNQLARSPRGTMKDEVILDMIMKEVRERRLDEYITRGCFRISTLDTSRRINCEYERPAKVLPGFEKTFHFKIDVDQPIIF